MDYSTDFQSANLIADTVFESDACQRAVKTNLPIKGAGFTDAAVHFPCKRRDPSAQEHPFFPAFAGSENSTTRHRHSSQRRADTHGRGELFLAFLDLPVSAWTSNRNQ